MATDMKKDPVPPFLSERVSTSEHHESVAIKPDIELQETPAYGPDGIRGLVSSGYVLGAAFLASLGGFSFGYDQGVISIINVMEQFHAVFPQAATAFGKGLMTGMLLLGAFVGCLFMPYLADRISRKWALTVVVVIFDIGAIIQTCSQNYAALVAGRAIGGIGVGTLAMVCYMVSRSSLNDPYQTNWFISLTWSWRVPRSTFPKSLRLTYEERSWCWSLSLLSLASSSHTGLHSVRA